MRILLDYRPALRQRTGVGEFAHHLAAALASRLAPDDRLVLFSSSWKDRLAPVAITGALQVDARVPVRLLNLTWHRLEWPPVEWFSGPIDVAQSIHPVMVPSRAAVRFITIHDLYFLDHAGHTSAEVRRDYAKLVASHARRADGVVVVSEHTSRHVQERLDVPADRLILCSPGAPPWPVRDPPPSEGPILFVGTAEPRKNLVGLLQAYRMLAAAGPGVPPLMLAGRIDSTDAVLRSLIDSPVLEGRVQRLGYVSDEERQRLYREASMLVLPSFDEGFGLPALEAMTVGVPVVASRRGSLPEVLGGAGVLVEPDDHAGLARAMAEVLADAGLRRQMVEAGLRRAAEFQWSDGVNRLYSAYETALARRGHK